MRRVAGRAYGADEKRSVVERILSAWESSPNQRLGQFIANATRVDGLVVDTFSIEDEALADACERYAEAVRRG